MPTATTSASTKTPSKTMLTRISTRVMSSMSERSGPKISEVFKKAGIRTFAELADKTEDDLKTILSDAGSRYASKNPASWPKQAKMAAEGKWDELKEWQDNAKAGVE